MHWYLDVIKKYAVFQGRARRKEYWMFFLFNLIVTIILSIVESLIGMEQILVGIYSLILLLPSLGVAVRRLHDIGKTGWWLLIGLIPIIGGIVLLVFSCLDSEPGANKYGPSPK
ncbi:DUF805 domain-containing protein [Metabacillus indicus]|uniref:DUF805 domain-containing protein n=1 Tax=Metabacillus indicus TaxID=246786 RepID=UPI002A008505|nr:DUF805 domain-containing protein [Metabacillus indicus]MDX8290469.1 DUF805 domain-containing protein [Metabacillus indicus]